LHEVLPASVFGLFTKEASQAEMFPFGTTGMVMALLWLPDQQLVLDAGRESIP
jgi:hypothetical protein